MTVPIAIIGAGPAGITAAVQLRRSGIEFLLLEKSRAGGLLNEANCVENFPGVPGGVAGRLLATRLKRQLAAAGIQIKKARVTHLAYDDRRFTLCTERETLTAARVILACGTVPLPPGPPLDTENLRGRLFAGVLPLLKARGETIAIIGGGDAACDYALSLVGNNEVHILVRSRRPRALPLLVDRCRRLGVVWHENFRLTRAEVLAGEAGMVLHARDAHGEDTGGILCQRLLTAIGREPALGFLAPELRAALPELAARKAVFLAGDVGNGGFRQAAIAAAGGLRAPMEIQEGGRTFT
jgi:thioredoxin reductase